MYVGVLVVRVCKAWKWKMISHLCESVRLPVYP